MWWDHMTLRLNRRTSPQQRNRCNFIASIRRAEQEAKNIAVVIPVFNASAEVEACLESVERYTRKDIKIIVIDDCSTETAIQGVLSKYRNSSRFKLYRNNKNQGFTKTVNRGFSLSEAADVVLLNSDTTVPPGWISRLRLAAYAEERIGTATALSDNAGAFSAPIVGERNFLPKAQSFGDIARAIAQTSLRIYPRTPTGSGFCMYIKRACLDDIGYFDDVAFPRGYGEENDFCMRASRKEWTHVVDDSTYVQHTRCASFGEEKQKLVKQGREIIDQRYPDYTAAVRSFVKSDAMVTVRGRIEETFAAIQSESAAIRSRILYVLPALSSRGGTPQTNQDLMKALEGQIETYLLSSNKTHITLFLYRDGQYIVIESATLKKPIEAFLHRSDEYDEIVADWLVQYSIELVHVRHIAWHSLGLLDIAKALDIPVLFSFHDYYMVCPTIKLLDENRIYCEGTCTASRGKCRPELWDDADLQPLKHEAVLDWKRGMGQALQKCDVFITTSEKAKDTIKKNYPALTAPFYTVPHGRDFKKFARDLVPNISPEGPLRIVVPGSIGYAKGAGVLVELAKRTKQYGIEIHVIGRLNEVGEVPGVIEHGAYDREDFIEKIAAIRPHVGAVFSIWPETYCHTLTELWAAGVPVIGFDYGAVSERISSSQAGWVLPDPDAEAVLQLCRQLKNNPDEHAAKIRKVWAWQEGEGTRQNCNWMARQYVKIYGTVADIEWRESEPEQLKNGLRPRFQRRPPPAPFSQPLGLVSVVIPVHNALEDVKKCITSVLLSSFPAIELVVVNDGSDPETYSWLENISCRHRHIRLVHHENARGYTVAVNEGVASTHGEYVVILNSDTIVPPFWLERLVGPMVDDPVVAATGGLSNAATWQSVPRRRNERKEWEVNEIPGHASVADYDRFVQLQARGLKPTSVSLLNGFCYAVRRKAFDEVGGLDAEAFPSGYGEETDLFLKLNDAGYLARLVPNLYIYHAKSKSFGRERRNKLSAQGNQVLKQRWGDGRIQDAAATLKNDPSLSVLRFRCSDLEALESYCNAASQALTLVFLLPARPGGGGVHSVVQESQGLQGFGYRVHILVPRKFTAAYRSFYPAAFNDGMFKFYDNDSELLENIKHVDVIAATHFFSVRLLRKAYCELKGKLFLYYVQDYEPWIVPVGSDHFHEAFASYGELESAVLVAKTDWIRGKVYANHGVGVYKIAPSIDHSIYKPKGAEDTGRSDRGGLQLAAMIRPATPRRAPQNTIDVLEKIRVATDIPVKFVVFGCRDEDLEALDIPAELNLDNREILTREGVAKVLQESDLFVDMSFYQAFGRTAIEAMACGTVAVIPEFGGGSEYALGSRAVLQIPTEDVDISASKIVDLIHDGNRLNEMREWGKMVASQFSIRKAGLSLSEVILLQVDGLRQDSE